MVNIKTGTKIGTKKIKVPMKFIDSFIKNLKPESNWYEKTESSGLGIRIMPSGSKSWIYRYTLNGKRQKMTLGKYPAMSLKQASKGGSSTGTT